MVAELITILTFFISGALLAKAFNIKGWVIIPVGFLAGLSLFTLTTYIMLAGLKASNPYVLLTATFLIALATFTISSTLTGVKKFNLKHVGITLLGLCLLVFAFYNADLAKYHFDSGRYLLTGNLIATENTGSLYMNLISKRFSSVSILHSPSHMADDFYIRSLTPLISISILMLVAWVVIKLGVIHKVKNKKIALFAGVGLLLFLSNRGYLWHSFYINGHLLFGSLLLLAVVCGWLVVSDKAEKSERAGLLAIQSLSVIGLILTRPESSFYVVIAILPFLLSPKIEYKYRLMLLYSFGIALILQQGFIVFIGNSIGRNIAITHLMMMLSGFVALATAPLLQLKKLTKYSSLLLSIFAGAVWLALAAFAAREPTILLRSLRATWQNIALGSGGWDLSLIALIVLAIACLVLLKLPKQRYLTYSITLFIPMSFLIAYLREGGYRVGVTDSLNRMLMHIIPLLVLYVIVAIAYGTPRFERKSKKPLKAKTSKK